MMSTILGEPFWPVLPRDTRILYNTTQLFFLSVGHLFTFCRQLSASCCMMTSRSRTATHPSAKLHITSRECAWARSPLAYMARRLVPRRRKQASTTTKNGYRQGLPPGEKMQQHVQHCSPLHLQPSVPVRTLLHATQICTWSNVLSESQRPWWMYWLKLMT